MADVSDVARREIAKLDYEFHREDALTRLRFQAEFSQMVFRGLTLINGGAIVALFTFIGSSKEVFQHHRIWIAFACYALGLTLTMISTMTAFFAQAYYMRHSISCAWNHQAIMHGGEPQYVGIGKAEERTGTKWENGAIAAATGGLFAFIIGSGFALAGALL